MTRPFSVFVIVLATSVASASQSANAPRSAFAPDRLARIDQARGGVSLDCGRCSFQRWAMDVARHRNVDIVVTGHTHLPTSAEHGDRLFLNSGTCCNSQISFLSLDTRRGHYGVHASY